MDSYRDRLPAAGRDLAMGYSGVIFFERPFRICDLRPDSYRVRIYDIYNPQPDDNDL